MNQHRPNDLFLKQRSWLDTVISIWFESHISKYSKLPGIFQTKWRDCGVWIEPCFLKKRDGVFCFLWLYGSVCGPAVFRSRRSELSNVTVFTGSTPKDRYGLRGPCLFKKGRIRQQCLALGTTKRELWPKSLIRKNWSPSKNSCMQIQSRWVPWLSC